MWWLPVLLTQVAQALAVSTALAATRLQRMCHAENLTSTELLGRWVKQRYKALGFSLHQTAMVPPVRSRYAQVELKELESLAENLLTFPQPILLTWTTGQKHFVQQALNLALSVRANVPQLEKQLAIITLDQQGQQELSEYGFQTLLHEHTMGMDDLVWKFRWQLLLMGVRNDLRLAVVDSDVVVFQDPFPLMARDADLEVATEHFWPEKHLWKPWVRPEDDLSTGFIYATPSKKLAAFLEDFLTENKEEVLPGRLFRDPFDQRVFNKFVKSRARQCAPCVVGFYQNLSYDVLTGAITQQSPDALRIRVLDPAKVVANGVNYFWRKAHLAMGLAAPALAHANGVGPKSYFLQDRGVWYVDDLIERYGASDARFLQYVHPQNLGLSEDFAYLSAALELANTFGRRLILPETMNCRNCPAYEAYGLNETLATAPGCTPDYFAYMFRLYHVHGDMLVPAGVAKGFAFQDLWPLKPMSSEVILASKSLASSEPALVFSGNILQLREHLLKEGNLKRHRCGFHEWPHRFMACRDDAFANDFGACQPQPEQSACGLEGFVCCISHHGRADRLEYYTGVPWDLPCNCGLPCPDVAGNPTFTGARCCGDACTWASEANVVPPAKTNPEKDLPFASSTILADFVDGQLTPKEVFGICAAHRSVYFLAREPLEGLVEKDCNIMVSNYLVGHQHWEAARKWWSFSLQQRRGPEAAMLPEQVQLSFLSLASAEEQLRALSRSAPLAEEYEKMATLRREYSRWKAGSLDRNALLVAAKEASLGRALHVPGFELDPALVEPLTPNLLDGKPQKMLSMEVCLRLVELLQTSTIWFTTLGGVALEAQLRDGLHQPPFLELGRWLSSVLGLALVDLRARSYAESTLGVECIPGASHLAVLSLSENVTVTWTEGAPLDACDGPVPRPTAQWAETGVELGSVVVLNHLLWHQLKMPRSKVGFHDHTLVLLFYLGLPPETPRQVLRRKAFMHEHDQELLKYDTW